MAKRKPRPLALVDLDGTLADFDSAMREKLAALRGPNEDPALEESAYEAVPHMTARRRLIKNQPGFWRNLAPLPLGFAIVEILRELDFKLHVLTRGPAKSPNGWTEKVLWCEEHLPGVPVTVGHDKSMVYGKVLVDDWPSYYEKWQEHRPRGLVVVPAQPWNVSALPGPNLIRVESTPHDLDKLREKLKFLRDS